MKFTMLLPMLSIVLAMSMFAGKNAEAADVLVSVDSDHHHMGKTPVDVTTSDPEYTAWYGNSDTTYNYGRPSSGNGRSSSAFTFTTKSPDYSAWYGAGSTGRATTNMRGSGGNIINANGGNGRGPGAQ